MAGVTQRNEHMDQLWHTQLSATSHSLAERGARDPPTVSLREEKTQELFGSLGKIPKLVKSNSPRSFHVWKQILVPLASLFVLKERVGGMCVYIAVIIRVCGKASF